MKKIAHMALCIAAALSFSGTAAGVDPAGQQIARAGTQAPMAGPAANFDGPVRVDPLTKVNADINAASAWVTFTPGAHSHWHTHPRGQYLIVTAGAGLTQEWGQPVQAIHPGDVIWCPPGVKHWHGAAANSPMTHLAMTGAADGKSVTWLEKVSPAQFNAATAAQPKASSMPTSTILSTKQASIPPIAAAMAGSDMPRLRTALARGLDAGLTVSETKEILVHLYAYAGFPRSLNALGELLKLTEARKQAGIDDQPGREPTGPVATGAALLEVGTANQTRISGAPVKGPVFDFAPAINQFLQAHLFGDLFERDNLDWQSRELATVGALAAVPGLEAQLTSHMNASMNVGLTAAQLRQVVEVLRASGDAAAADRAGVALDARMAAKGAP